MVPLRASAATRQREREDSSSAGAPTDGVTSNDQLHAQVVSQFIQNHFADARLRTRSEHSSISNHESAALPIAGHHMGSSICALLERLQSMSSRPDVTVTVSTNNNNHQLSITSQNQPENLRAVLDPSSQRSEVDFLANLLTQAEQNRVQFQQAINQLQLSELLSTSQQQQQQQQQQNARSAIDLLLSSQRGAGNFLVNLTQNEDHLRTASSNEQIVQDALARLTPSSSSPQSNGGGGYGGSLSSLTAADHRAPITRFINSQICPANSSVTLNDSNSTNNVLATALWNQSWNA